MGFVRINHSAQLTIRRFIHSWLGGFKHERLIILERTRRFPEDPRHLPHQWCIHPTGRFPWRNNKSGRFLRVYPTGKNAKVNFTAVCKATNALADPRGRTWCLPAPPRVPNSFVLAYKFMVPTQTGKPGKVGEFYPIYWKNQGILPKILEKWGNFCQFLFLFLSDFLIKYYILNRCMYLFKFSK